MVTYLSAHIQVKMHCIESGTIADEYTAPVGLTQSHSDISDIGLD